MRSSLDIPAAKPLHRLRSPDVLRQHQRRSAQLRILCHRALAETILGAPKECAGRGVPFGSTARRRRRNRAPHFSPFRADRRRPDAPPPRSVALARLHPTSASFPTKGLTRPCEKGIPSSGAAPVSLVGKSASPGTAQQSEAVKRCTVAGASWVHERRSEHALPPPERLRDGFDPLWIRAGRGEDEVVDDRGRGREAASFPPVLTLALEPAKYGKFGFRNRENSPALGCHSLPD